MTDVATANERLLLTDSNLQDVKLFDGVAEAFVNWAKSENLSFWRG